VWLGGNNLLCGAARGNEKSWRGGNIGDVLAEKRGGSETRPYKFKTNNDGLAR
jgi:hypothetical protein